MRETDNFITTTVKGWGKEIEQQFTFSAEKSKESLVKMKANLIELDKAHHDSTRKYQNLSKDAFSRALAAYDGSAKKVMEIKAGSIARI